MDSLPPCQSFECFLFKSIKGHHVSTVTRLPFLQSPIETHIFWFHSWFNCRKLVVLCFISLGLVFYHQHIYAKLLLIRSLCVCSVTQLCSTLPPARLLCPWDSSGKNTGVGCPALLQGIFPTQGSNPGLLHCRQIFYHLPHQGSPFKLYQYRWMPNILTYFSLLSRNKSIRNLIPQ